MGLFDFLFLKKKKRKDLENTKRELRNEGRSKGLKLYKKKDLAVASVPNVDEEPDILFITMLCIQERYRKITEMGY